MIVVVMLGGLGNQLFQYAFGRYLADLHNTELWLDVTTYEPGFNFQHDLEIRKLAIRCDRYLIRDKRFDIEGLMKDYDIPLHVVDGGQDVDSLIFKSGAVLQGEWSSHTTYLMKQSVRPRLLTETKSSAPISAISLMQEIESMSDAVFVHVRRGNYVQNQHLFRVVDLGYYNRAFAFLERHVAHPTYFVFSDEIDWVEQHMPFDRDVRYVHEPSAVDSLQLARACRHFVAANSTYSWWSAYLGIRSGKIVIFPEQYFNEPELQKSWEESTSYLLPNWVRL